MMSYKLISYYTPGASSTRERERVNFAICNEPLSTVCKESIQLVLELTKKGGVTDSAEMTRNTRVCCGSPRTDGEWKRLDDAVMIMESLGTETTRKAL